MSTNFPTKLKDPRTCRIFFSSPFGGMEEEREELTRKYFPQIHHLCNSRGIQFVPVDMRWGITSEATENAQTVNICLREIDRCDLFVGLYGVRYGWHGSDDKKFQKNIDNAVGRYPWLNSFRDRSATELEFLHGHLNSPGSLPACFGFRDGKFDNQKADSLKKSGDTKLAVKYCSESEEARRKIVALKEKIESTKSKTLAVHPEYSTPQQGAKFMFDALWEHLNKVLLSKSDEEIPERLEELADNDSFMATRQALYVGGEQYFPQLDDLLVKNDLGKVVVTGEAGQGKSALLANWVSHIKETQPKVILAYHFVGSSKNSNKPKNVVKRLKVEVSEFLPKVKDDAKDKPDKEDSGVKSETEGNSGSNNKGGAGDADTNRNQTVDVLQSDETKDLSADMSKDVSKDVSKDEDKDVSKDVDESNKESVKPSPQDPLANGDNSSDDKQLERAGSDDGNKDKSSSEKADKDGEKSKDKNDAKSENKDQKKKSDGSVRDLMKDLVKELERAEKEGCQVVLVIDGLDKVITGGKIAKPVYWLPETGLPKNVKIVVSILDSESTIIEELVSTRKYTQIALPSLSMEHKTQICLKTLEMSGKALSKDQLKKVLNKDQTKNPLFLKITMAELSVFGSFRKLDEKIDALLSSTSIGKLCDQVLTRMEADYNSPEHPQLVQQVFRLIRVSHDGLSEAELVEMLDIPTHVWSPLFFALEQFIVVHSSLISFAFSELGSAVDERYLNSTEESFAFSELGSAVDERYLNSTEERVQASKCIIDYFDKKRKDFHIWPRPAYSLLRRPAYELSWLQKEIGDAEGLTRTLTDLLMTQTIIVDNEYELFELWKFTGHKFVDIANMYIQSFDRSLVDIYCNENDDVWSTDNRKPPGQRLLYLLENIRFFMDLASCTPGCTKIIERIIQILQNLDGKWDGSDRKQLLAEHRYYLACNYCDEGQFKQAAELHSQVVDFWKQGKENGEIETKMAEERIAWCYNGIGLVKYHQRQYEESDQYFRDSLALHEKYENIRNAADSLTNIGLVHIGQKKPLDAVKDFEKALKLYEEHHYDSTPHTIGNLYTNIGLAYRRANKINQAEEYYFKSLQLKAQAVGWEHVTIATAYLNLGTLENYRKNYDKVEEYTVKAMEIYKINQCHGDSREMRQGRENMANCYIRMNKFETAKPWYWEVFDTLTRLDLMDECLAFVHNSMAKHYMDGGHYDTADRILTVVARCAKRNAKTFLYLDQLDKLKEASGDVLEPRPDDLTLDHGLTLFPYNASLVREKMMVHFIGKGDLDGAEEYYAKHDMEAGDYIQLATWCEEDKKPGIAAEILERGTVKFPDVSELNGECACAWNKMKHYDKALVHVRKLDPDTDYEKNVQVCCVQVLAHFDHNEDAKKWLQNLKKKDISDIKSEVDQLTETLEKESV